MRYRTTLMISGLAMLMSGCTESLHPPTTAERFGEAVHNNMALHIVDPVPSHPTALAPTDGDRRGLMIARYKLDRAEKPEETGASTVAPQGGQGGQGGQGR